MQPENSSHTDEVSVSLIVGGVLIHKDGATPVRVDSTLFHKHVFKLLRSKLQLRAEVRTCHSIQQPPIKLLVVSIPTSRKVAIAIPPAPEHAAIPFLIDHPDIDACMIQNTWWPNLVAEGLPPPSVLPRYARIRGLRP